MAKEKQYVLGVDYGSDSVRSVLVDAENGKEIANAVSYYKRWKKGLYCEAHKNQFRQHPLDYIEGLKATITEILNKIPKGANKYIKAIGIDTTGSSPCILGKDMLPLAMQKDFSENPNAMIVLWKDHTSIKEAEEINKLAHSWGGIDYTKYSGGVYSSEWFWAKMLHVMREDKKVQEAAYSFAEHCDWFPALLTGTNSIEKMKRSRCAAGHKAMWNEEWGGLPSEEFLVKLDPILKGFRDRLYTKTYTSDKVAGKLTPEWAKKLGLTEDVIVGVGAFDAHMGAVGGGITKYSLSRVMGTSTCDILVAPHEDVKGIFVKGICGQVDGSVIPNMMGFEAGQSSFGDVYAWFKSVLMWSSNLVKKSKTLSKNKELQKSVIEEMDRMLIPEIERMASLISPEQTGVVALDWINGRRTPFANQALKGAIFNLSLGVDAVRIYKALVDATAFGARKIVECFETQGVKIEKVIGLGGVAKKSPLVMQTLSDVLNRDILIPKSEHTCAIGAAVFASVNAGIYKTIEEASKHMFAGFEKTYKPIKENVKKYEDIYKKYNDVGKFVEEFTK